MLASACQSDKLNSSPISSGWLSESSHGNSVRVYLMILIQGKVSHTYINTPKRSHDIRESSVITRIHDI
jgi:hypothetical protein